MIWPHNSWELTKPGWGKFRVCSHWWGLRRHVFYQFADTGEWVEVPVDRVLRVLGAGSEDEVRVILGG